MPHWNPKSFWRGKDVYIIGGGYSLENFNWELLRDKPVIGCNSAFILGADICDICFFSDVRWFNRYYKELENFEGFVVTNSPDLQKSNVPWLFIMKRVDEGLGYDGLGWKSGNSGACALNLALIVGAKRVLLLGFDMKLKDNETPNWHDRGIDKPSSSWYERFKSGFRYVVRDREKKFPGREIINVTDDSDLEVFPKMSLVEHFGKDHKLCLEK